MSHSSDVRSDPATESDADTVAAASSGSASDPAAFEGVLAFYGGGPFEAHDELDRALLAEVGADTVVVLPTADAFEQPAELVAAAERWGARIGAAVIAPMVLQRHDATPEVLETVLSARAVYIVGDSAMHLRSVLKDSELLLAVGGVLTRGGLVVAAGASASALCDPMFDQRGGAFTLGLGLVRGRAVLPEPDALGQAAVQRARELADVPLAELPTEAALVYRAGEWSAVGDVAGSWFDA